MTSSSPSLATNATSPAKFVLNLPPGFHFLPTDDELVVHYLRPRLAKRRLPLPIFVHERILNYHPDKLVEEYRNYGEGRWFFFTERERKHEGGNRPNRTTPDNGHWNATGSIRPIRSAGGVLVGCRRTLVFYEASRSRKKKRQAAGLPPPTEEEGDAGGQAAAKAKDGVKTEWTMYEYESLTSEAEFEAIRRGNANKMDDLVLCTIQKKKYSQEGGETTTTTTKKKKKKSTKRKTKEQGPELEAVPAGAAGGDVEQGSRAGTTEGQDEDDVQRALMESAAAEPLPELAYHAPAAAGVDDFNVDPGQNMPYYYLTNSLSPVPTPSQQETLMAPASGGNNIVIHQQNYYINHSMNMKNSQPFDVQETRPREFLPYLDTKTMAAPRGGGNTMDHMLQNMFFNMTPSQTPPVQGTGTYLGPRRSKSDVWERSAELPAGDKPNRPLKPEAALWSSYCQAKLPGRELNSAYVSNSSPFVPTPQGQTAVMALAASAREYNHTAMHERNYVNHSMNMRNLQFHVQAATLPQEEEFLSYSSTKMAAPLGGVSILDHHMVQNRIVNVMMPAAEAHTFTGFFPSLSNSNSGHLSTRMDRPGPSSVSLPPQQSHGAGSRTGMQGPLLNNQVNLNHQSSAAAAAFHAWYRI